MMQNVKFLVMVMATRKQGKIAWIEILLVDIMQYLLGLELQTTFDKLAALRSIFCYACCTRRSPCHILQADHARRK
jgi:hypothetical protein